nr:hypothetical protein CFP56_30818 [Quercus suber]
MATTGHFCCSAALGTLVTSSVQHNFPLRLCESFSRPLIAKPSMPLDKFPFRPGHCYYNTFYRPAHSPLLEDYLSKTMSCSARRRAQCDRTDRPRREDTQLTCICHSACTWRVKQALMSILGKHAINSIFQGSHGTFEALRGWMNHCETGLYRISLALRTSHRALLCGQVEEAPGVMMFGNFENISITRPAASATPETAQVGAKDIGWQALAPAIVCTVASTVIVVLRWYTRYRIARCLGSDDCVILHSLVSVKVTQSKS